MAWVIYCRVSPGSRSPFAPSLEEQVEGCLRCAKENGFRPAVSPPERKGEWDRGGFMVFVDKVGASSNPMARRGYRELLRSKAPLVLVLSSGIFGRGPASLTALRESAKSYGVAVKSCGELSPGGEVKVSFVDSGDEHITRSRCRSGGRGPWELLSFVSYLRGLRKESAVAAMSRELGLGRLRHDQEQLTWNEVALGVQNIGLSPPTGEVWSGKVLERLYEAGMADMERRGRPCRPFPLEWVRLSGVGAPEDGWR